MVTKSIVLCKATCWTQQLGRCLHTSRRLGMRSRPSTQACLTRACAEVMQGPGACVAMYACSPHMRAAHVVCEGSAAAARTCVPGRRSDAPSFVVTTHSCACRRSSMPAHAAGVVGADKVPRVERVFVDAACEAQRLSASQRASHARRTARSQAIASVSPQAQGGRPYTPPWHWALMHRSMCALRRAGRASDHRPQLHHPHRVLEEHVLDAVQPALPAPASGLWRLGARARAFAAAPAQDRAQGIPYPCGHGRHAGKRSGGSFHAGPSCGARLA
jgi:hypothetical protein